MKKIAQSIVVVALSLSLVGCASLSKNDEPARLTVRSLIDGADLLKIRGDQIWFEHLAYELPGRWSGSDYATTINGDIEWQPVWNGDFSDTFVIEDQESILPAGVAFNEDTLSVKSNRALNQVTISEYPTADNDYTLVIYLDDRDPFGPHWYDLRIDWDE